MQLETANRDNL